MHRISGAAGALTAVAAISTLTAADSGARTGTETGAEHHARSCSALTAEIVPLRGAAAGTTFADLVVVNHGKNTCTLPGQPTLQYLDGKHRPIAVAFGPDHSVPSHKLPPGASAAMAVGYGTDGNPPCDATIAYVRVTPPGTDVPYDGATHCADDTTYEGNWVTGSYAAPH